MKLLIATLLVSSIWFCCVYGSFDENYNNDDIDVTPNMEEQYLPSEEKEQYLPSEENEQYLPSEEEEQYLPSEEQEQFIPSEEGTLLEENSGRQKVAALVALTGDASYLGQVVKAGFDKAINDKKEACTSTYEKCKVPSVTFHDTGSIPGKALHLFKRSYSQGIRTFIGLVTSDEAKMVAKYASKHATDAVLFTPTSTATELCKYKQLYRMSMDDRGYAEVLFDLAVGFKAKGSPYYIQVIHRNNVHGRGLYKDISKEFGKVSKDYKILSPIYYEEGTALTSSKVNHLIKQIHKSPIIRNKKNSLIVLAGLTETQLILQEADTHPSLRHIKWILSNDLTLSNLKIPQDMEVFGLSFEGKDVPSRLLNRERRGLNKYLIMKKLPHMAQAYLAYDVITVLQMVKSFPEYIKNSMTIEGLTGPLEFSKCRERFTGSYVFADSPNKKEIDNMAKKIIIKNWITLVHFFVESTDRSYLLQDTEATMMEIELQSTVKKAVTATGAPAVEIKKSDFLKEIAAISDSKTCEKNAQVTVNSKDELSGEPVNTTYTIAEMPETIVLPAKYGFVMIAKCRTKKNNLELTRVCPGTNAGGTEITCQTKTSNTAIGKVVGQGGCFGLTTLYYACLTGAAACFIAAIATAGTFAPWCGLGSVGCAVINEARKKACKYVCTELFRQGFLSADIMLADMSFAKHYSVDFPITRQGYDILGPMLASWMSYSEWITNIVKSFAIPWAEEMAYNEGLRDIGNDFGALVMNVGSVICAIVGGIYIYFNYIIGISVLIGLLMAAKKVAQIKSISVPFAKKFN